jgi:hypothetical protein
MLITVPHYTMTIITQIVDLESIPLGILPTNDTTGQLLTANEAMLDPTVVWITLPMLTQGINMAVGNEDHDTLLAIAENFQYSEVELGFLRAGQYDEVEEIPDFSELLSLEEGDDWRAEAPNPEQGSKEVDYIGAIGTAYTNGGMPGISNEYSALGNVILGLTGRSSGDLVRRFNRLLTRSKAKGVCGACKYTEREYEKELLWKVVVFYSRSARNSLMPWTMME